MGMTGSVRRTTFVVVALVMTVAGLSGCGHGSTPAPSGAAQQPTSDPGALVVAASRAWVQAQLQACANDGAAGVAFDRLGCGMKKNPGIDARQPELGGRDGSAHYNQVRYLLDPSIGIGDPDLTHAAAGTVTWSVGVDPTSVYAVDFDGTKVVQPFEPGASSWTVSTCSPSHATTPSAVPANCDPLSD